MEGVDHAVGSRFDRDADTNGAWQLGLGLFQRNNVADCELRIGTFFDANPAADEDRNFQFYLILQPPIGFRKNQQVQRAGHVFERGLGVELAFLGFQHPHIGDHPRRMDFVLARGILERRNFLGGERSEVRDLVLVLLQRMSGDEETENFFFASQAQVLVPIR